MTSEPPEHTSQPTVLVNEPYLELLKIRALPESGDPDPEREKEAFFGLARIL